MSRPNVLYVMTDQLRASALSCYGNDDITTPTIDRLAYEGMRFDCAVSSAPVCTPARGCVQTGCLPHEHRATANWSPISYHRPGLAEYLHEAGYRTGYIGKWHLDGQTGRDHYNAPRENAGFVPPGKRRMGWNFWSGFNDDHSHHEGHPKFTRDGEEYRVGEYQPTVQTDIAIDFIERNREEPWCCFLSWGPPHPPFEAPGNYADPYDPADLALSENVPEEMDARALRENLAEYYGMIESLDDELNRLLGTLDELDLTEDTIVVFTADHGEMLGAHGHRLGKNESYDEAAVIPLLVRYPGTISPGSVSDAPVGLIDHMPTLLSLCNVEVPSALHGRDISSHIRGEADGPDVAYMEGFGLGWRALRTERYVIHVTPDLDVERLYDTVEDPCQLDNLVADRPELREELLERLIERAYETVDRDIMASDFRGDRRF